MGRADRVAFPTKMGHADRVTFPETKMPTVTPSTKTLVVLCAQGLYSGLTGNSDIALACLLV